MKWTSAVWRTINDMVKGSNEIEPTGLGNRNDLVGRFFMEHPHNTIGVLTSDRPAHLTGLYGRRELAGAVAVSEAAVRSAMVAAVRLLKVVVEPSGAVGLAAVLASVSRDTQCVGVILSGGNVDPPLLADVLRADFN